MLLHELFSIYFAFLHRQRRNVYQFPVSCSFYQRNSSVIKFLNAFSPSLLKKQWTQSWTLKIIRCGFTTFLGGSLPQPLASIYLHLHLFILKLVLKWGCAYKLKSSWLKEFFARVWLSDKLSPSFPFPLPFSSAMI